MRSSISAMYVPTMGLIFHTVASPSLAFAPVPPVPITRPSPLVTTTSSSSSRSGLLPPTIVAMTRMVPQEEQQQEQQERSVADAASNQQLKKQHQKKLGIDIGKQMEFCSTPEEKEELKAELSKIIDTAVEAGITDLEKLHKKWQRDLEDGKSLANVQKAMRTNGKLASYKFNRKVDALVDTFFSQTLESRKRTHDLATEDEERILREQREKDRKKRKAESIMNNPPSESWEKTNDAWDKEWDDW